MANSAFSEETALKGQIGMVSHAFSLRAWETEAGRVLSSRPAGVVCEVVSNEGSGARRTAH